MTKTRYIYIYIGILSFAVLTLITFLFTGGITKFNSDAAAEVNLAVEMIRTNSLFPQKWISSTSIHIFQFIIYFFLHFTSNYLIAKTFAQVFVLAVVVRARRKRPLRAHRK